MRVNVANGLRVILRKAFDFTIRSSLTGLRKFQENLKLVLFFFHFSFHFDYLCFSRLLKFNDLFIQVSFIRLNFMTELFTFHTFRLNLIT